MTESSETKRFFDEHPFKLTFQSKGRISLWTDPFDLKFGDTQPTDKKTLGMAIIFMQEVYNKL